MKNMLTALKGSQHIISMGHQAADFDSVGKGLGLLDRVSTRLYLLLMNMLDYSKSRSVEVAPTDVAALVGEVIEVLKTTAESRSIYIQTRMRPDIGRFPLDGNLLHRALVNLGANAIDAMEFGGILTITAAITGDDESAARVGDAPTVPSLSHPGHGRRARPAGACSSRCTTRDPACPRKWWRKLFQPFFSTKGSRGTGLGLATTRQFVDDSGGTISVETKTGEGTAVRINPAQRSASRQPARRLTGLATANAGDHRQQARSPPFSRTAASAVFPAAPFSPRSPSTAPGCGMCREWAAPPMWVLRGGCWRAWRSAGAWAARKGAADATAWCLAAFALAGVVRMQPPDCRADAGRVARRVSRRQPSQGCHGNRDLAPNRRRSGARRGHRARRGR